LKKKFKFKNFANEKQINRKGYKEGMKINFGEES
jgi:hypothetical protein